MSGIRSAAYALIDTVDEYYIQAYGPPVPVVPSPDPSSRTSEPALPGEDDDATVRTSRSFSSSSSSSSSSHSSHSSHSSPSSSSSSDSDSEKSSPERRRLTRSPSINPSLRAAGGSGVGVASVRSSGSDSRPSSVESPPSSSGPPVPPPIQTTFDQLLLNLAALTSAIDSHVKAASETRVPPPSSSRLTPPPDASIFAATTAPDCPPSPPVSRPSVRRTTKLPDPVDPTLTCLDVELCFTAISRLASWKVHDAAVNLSSSFSSSSSSSSPTTPPRPGGVQPPSRSGSLYRLLISNGVVAACALKASLSVASLLRLVDDKARRLASIVPVDASVGFMPLGVLPSFSNDDDLYSSSGSSTNNNNSSAFSPLPPLGSAADGPCSTSLGSRLLDFVARVSSLVLNPKPPHLANAANSNVAPTASASGRTSDRSSSATAASGGLVSSETSPFVSASKRAPLQQPGLSPPPFKSTASLPHLQPLSRPLPNASSVHHLQRSVVLLLCLRDRDPASLLSPFRPLFDGVSQSSSSFAGQPVVATPPPDGAPPPPPPASAPLNNSSGADAAAAGAGVGPSYILPSDAGDVASAAHAAESAPSWYLPNSMSTVTLMVLHWIQHQVSRFSETNDDLAFRERFFVIDFDYADRKGLEEGELGRASGGTAKFGSSSSSSSSPWQQQQQHQQQRLSPTYINESLEQQHQQQQQQHFNSSLLPSSSLDGERPTSTRSSPNSRRPSLSSTERSSPSSATSSSRRPSLGNIQTLHNGAPPLDSTVSPLRTTTTTSTTTSPISFFFGGRRSSKPNMEVAAATTTPTPTTTPPPPTMTSNFSASAMDYSQRDSIYGGAHMSDGATNPTNKFESETREHRQKPSFSPYNRLIPLLRTLVFLLNSGWIPAVVPPTISNNNGDLESSSSSSTAASSFSPIVSTPRSSDILTPLLDIGLMAIYLESAASPQQAATSQHPGNTRLEFVVELFGLIQTMSTNGLIPVATQSNAYSSSPHGGEPAAASSGNSIVNPSSSVTTKILTLACLGVNVEASSSWSVIKTVLAHRLTSSEAIKTLTNMLRAKTMKVKKHKTGRQSSSSRRRTASKRVSIGSEFVDRDSLERASSFDFGAEAFVYATDQDLTTDGLDAAVAAADDYDDGDLNNTNTSQSDDVDTYLDDEDGNHCCIAVNAWEAGPGALTISRGAIYGLGMALWGSQRIPLLRVYWSEGLDVLSEIVCAGCDDGGKGLEGGAIEAALAADNEAQIPISQKEGGVEHLRMNVQVHSISQNTLLPSNNNNAYGGGAASSNAVAEAAARVQREINNELRLIRNASMSLGFGKMMPPPGIYLDSLRDATGNATSSSQNRSPKRDTAAVAAAAAAAAPPTGGRRLEEGFVPMPVVYEVALSIHRLVRKYGDNLGQEWKGLISALWGLSSWIIIDGGGRELEWKGGGSDATLRARISQEVVETFAACTRLLAPPFNTYLLPPSTPAALRALYLLKAAWLLPKKEAYAASEATLESMLSDCQPHKKHWSRNTNMVLHYFFAVFSPTQGPPSYDPSALPWTKGYSPLGFVHPPQMRIHVLNTLCSAEKGPLHTVNGVREWHSELLEIALIPHCVAIAKGSLHPNAFNIRGGFGVMRDDAEAEAQVVVAAVRALGSFAVYVTTEHRHRSLIIQSLVDIVTHATNVDVGKEGIRQLAVCLRSAFGELPHTHTSVIQVMNGLCSVANLFNSGSRGAGYIDLAIDAMMTLARLRCSHGGHGVLLGLNDMDYTSTPRFPLRRGGAGGVGAGVVVNNTQNNAAAEETLTAPFVFVGDESAESHGSLATRYGATVTLQPVVTVIGELLNGAYARLSSRKEEALPSTADSGGSMKALVSLCFLTLEALLLSGNSLVGVGIRDILNGVLVGRTELDWCPDNIARARAVAALSGYIGAVKSGTVPAGSAERVGALLCEFCIQENRELLVIGTRGLCSLVHSCGYDDSAETASAPASASAAAAAAAASGGGFLEGAKKSGADREPWIANVCSVLFAKLEHLQLQCEAARLHSTKRRVASDLALEESSIPLLSVIHDVFASQYKGVPNAILRLRGLLICNRFCRQASGIGGSGAGGSATAAAAATSAGAQLKMLALLCAAGILKQMTSDEGRAAAMTCSVAASRGSGASSASTLASASASAVAVAANVPQDTDDNGGGKDDGSGDASENLTGAVLDDLLIRSPGVATVHRGAPHSTRPHELFKKETEDVNNFVAADLASDGGAWLVGDALVSCRVGAPRGPHEGLAEIIMRSSTGRVRWLMHLAGSQGDTTSHSEAGVHGHDHVVRLNDDDYDDDDDDDDAALKRAKAIMAKWDMTEADLCSSGGGGGGGGGVKEAKTKTTTSTTPPSCVIREVQRAATCDDLPSSTESSYRGASRNASLPIPTKSPPNDAGNVALGGGSSSSVEKHSHSQQAPIRKSSSFSDFTAMSLNESSSSSPQQPSATKDGGNRKGGEMLRWLQGFLDSSEDVESVFKVLTSEFGYSGEIAELRGLNEEEVSEIVQNLSTSGIKLKIRQKIRRALLGEIAMAQKEKGERGDGGIMAGEQATSADGRTTMAAPPHMLPRSDVPSEKKYWSPPHVGSSTCAPQLSFQFLLENVFNFNCFSNSGVVGTAFPHMDLLTNNAALARAIAVLDRTPPIQTHKIALLFAGNGSDNKPFSYSRTVLLSKERGHGDGVLASAAAAAAAAQGNLEGEMIGAAHGSPRYNEFMSAIGDLVSVSDLTFYSAGLDTESGTDGKLALLWMSSGTECKKNVANSGESMILFHTPTLMPCHDGSYTKRKRHVGNDSVHIIFSEEHFILEGYERSFPGIKYNGGGVEKEALRISGQFGFVTILVMPIANTSAMRVEVILRKDVGGGGSGGGEEVRAQLLHLCGRAVLPKSCCAAFVRNVAIRADIACRGVTRDLLGSQNNWEERLSQLRAMQRFKFKG